MTKPGPLGRSMVIMPEAVTPPGWEDAEHVAIDATVLADPVQLQAVVKDAQRRYVERTPTIYLLHPSVELTTTETTDLAPYQLGGRFTFLHERLIKAVWHNSYDARGDEPIWWWAHKASRLGMTIGGPADVLTAEGQSAWIDGGPRQPFELDRPVIHHESIELGHANPVPPLIGPSADLAPDQLAAVSHLVGPARVIAPAGSGKTRVLTARFRHLIEDRAVEPAMVAALAYNNRAAEEMRERLPSEWRRSIRTIHSLGWEILRMAKPGLRLIDEREVRQRLEPIAKAPPRANTDVLAPYIDALDEVRIGLVAPDVVEAASDDIPDFANVYRRYRAGLAERGEADYAEQIYGAIEALCVDARLRAHWQGKCRHLLVDEFQDLTPAYLLLIRLLAGPGMNVFGVGDDDQVIYGYAGADPGFLIDFPDLFPGASVHALEVNYRCPADVVAGASTLLGYNRRRVDKTMTSSSDREGLEVALVGGDRLALDTADRIGGLVDGGVAPSTLVVLSRVNSSLLPVHAALAVRGIPFRSPLSAATLDRTLLRATFAWIRLALDPEAMRRSDLFEAVRRPGRGITRLFGTTIGNRRGPFSVENLLEIGQTLEGRQSQRWYGFCDDIVDASAETDSTAGLLELLTERIGLDRAAEALDSGRTRADRAPHGDDLTALRRLAAFAPEPARFEEWLRGVLATAQTDEGVLLSTVHRVKGLEWDHVFVFGADRDLMPHRLADDVEEERRVFHVAVTRGRKTVTVLADEARPSKFLNELDGSAPVEAEPVPISARLGGVGVADGISVVVGDQVDLVGGIRGKVDEVLTTGVIVKLNGGAAVIAVPWGSRLTKGTRTGPLTPDPGGADSGVVERLKTWRLEQSRTQGVPAYVVFNDRTLEALASYRPSTESELLTIPGIGPAKLEAYGDQLLEILAG